MADSTKGRAQAVAAAPTNGYSAAELFAKICNELVRGRIRHRALLEALIRAKVIDDADYLRAYERIEAEDFRALADMLLMKREEFERVYAGWLKRSRSKYGFQRHANVPQLSFDYKPERPRKPRKKRTSSK